MMMKQICAVLLIVAGTFLYAQEAYIREVIGTVEVKAPGTSAWRAARIGERISRDTLISTGFKSSVRIDLGNSTLIVRPVSRLSLEELQRIQNSESVQLNLVTGRVRADVRPPPSGKTAFTVRSPTGSASVRGTAFTFDGVNLNVADGNVYFTGGDGLGVYVGAGHRAVSDPLTGRASGAAEQFRAELTMTGPKITYTQVRASRQAPVLSSNANLSGLIVDYGLMDYFFSLSPEFSSGTTNYTVTVSLTSEINVTAIVAEPHATITINGNRARSGVPVTISGITIGGGRVVIPVVITAEDGKTIRTYTITATRPLI
jgi:hypothetical protein